MARKRTPVTPAIRLLRQRKIPFQPIQYDYEDKGGTAVAARELQVDEHNVVKTLVLVDDTGDHMLMLMHGDREVSLKQLARIKGVKRIFPASPDDAERLTGYRTGGISPFGIRTCLPVYMEETVAALPIVLINGGQRGLLVALEPDRLEQVLKLELVNVAIS